MTLDGIAVDLIFIFYLIFVMYLIISSINYVYIREFSEMASTDISTESIAGI